MINFKTTGPATIAIFYKTPTKYVKVFRGKQLYFSRDFKTPQERIKLNVAHAGFFTLNCDADTIDVLPLSIHELTVTLPPVQRNEGKPFKIIYNQSLTGTPARNFWKKGIIEIGPKFKAQPYPVRIFILLHEEGHFYYRDETLADLYAAKKFIEHGYNNSTAYYALKNVLNFESEVNKTRIDNLFKILHR